MDSNMNRNEWQFEYTAITIAVAAEAQRDYRESRVKAWEDKKTEVMTRIRESGIGIHEGVSDKMASYSNAAHGFGPQITIDATMQEDLTECATKIKTHRQAVTDYNGWIQVLRANPEARLKLKHDDWMYFFGK